MLLFAPLVVSLSNHERPFDKLRASGFILLLNLLV